MNKITVRVERIDRFLAQMGKAAVEARGMLKREVNTLGMLLAARIQNNRLRGQSLSIRSGRLISSIHHELTDNENEVRADVGTNVGYGAVHELGFRGVVQVKEHMRTIKMAFGRPIAPRQVLVKAHPVNVNMPQRAFLSPELVAFQPVVEQRMKRLAENIAQEVQK